MKKRIGIVGGGQLGRMLAIPAKKLGYHVNIIDPTPESPAGQIADHQITADFTDEEAIRELAAISDFLTFEIELANADILNALSEKGLVIQPSANTLSVIKDKLKQKEFLRSSEIPVADFVEITDRNDVLKTAEKFGYPMLLKARFDAYDGRGNALIENESGIDAGLKKLEGRRLYAEKFVPFVKELAIMVARNTDGEIVTYPVVQTLHKNNILHLLLSPAPIEKEISEKVKNLGVKVMEHLKGAGVFGIEMFLDKDNEVLINEIAPRVHNSGHHTIEANETSQFEQHIRAITGMKLGSTKMKAPFAVMINILGERTGKADPQGIEKAENIPGVSVHIYGKLETKPERKMGHITAIAESLDEALSNAKLARSYITI